VNDWSKERDELAHKIDNFGLVVHNLDAYLSSKVDTCNAQQFNDELCEAEKYLLDQIEELNREYQSLDHVFLEDANIEKSALKSYEGVDNITLGDLSVCIYGDINSSTIHELRRIRPHSNIFSTLCLDSKIVIEPSEPMRGSKGEDESAYILEFVVPSSNNYIPHLDTEKCTAT